MSRTGLARWGALAVLGVIACSTRLSAQTFVQVADMDPTNTVGPRLTSTVTQQKISRTLFGELNAKMTLIDAVASPAVAYEFASDGAWNRIVFGQKDVYIKTFDDHGANGKLASPTGIDVSGSRYVFIADELGNRIVIAQFNSAAQTLQQVASTGPNSLLHSVMDVAWDGDSVPLTHNSFYAVSGAGGVSYWTWQAPSGQPQAQWSYGSKGSGIGQFLEPRGVCVGHTLAASGGTVFTTSFYVADAANHRLVWLLRNNSGPAWEGSVTLPNNGVPTDCTVDQFGNVYVPDSANSQIIKYSSSLLFLDSYGTYGTGPSNLNTFAHARAIHVPYGTMRNGSGQTVWYGEGRILTAEDWGAQSGAVEHYLNVSLTLNRQPDTSTYAASFGYFATDHAYHVVRVYDGTNTSVRTISTGGSVGQLIAPGQVSWLWDGKKDDGTYASPGYYYFIAIAVSAYGCGFQWCHPTVVTQQFWFKGQLPCQPPAVQAAGAGAAQATSGLMRLGVGGGGGGCGGGTSSPPSGDADIPSTVFFRQRVLPGGRPLVRIQAAAGAAPSDLATTSEGSISLQVRQFGLRGLSFGVTQSASIAPVVIRVYTLSGRLVRTMVNERLSPGAYEVGWDGLDDQGRAAAPGVYIARMVIGQFSAMEHLVLRQP